MKKLLSTKHVLFFTVATCLAMCNAASAQSVVFAKEPQWKFWLAFENADGQKDTVYIVFDSTATEQPDSLLGEYKITPDTTKFQVFFANGIGNDSTKVWAWPEKNKGGGKTIDALNDNYPMVVRWDKSLFTSSSLSYQILKAELGNTYTLFYRLGGAPFNLRETDSVILPPFTIQGQPARHFGMSFFFNDEPPLSIPPIYEAEFIAYPKPFSNYLQIRCPVGFDQIEIVSIFNGETVFRKENIIQGASLELTNLAQEVYLLKITNSQTNQSYYEKIIKY
ncbi:MAG: T9SS type A sorting domain-containing protein [Bacteroidia bacterium]|nr:T9SS type A sorting domain-containing protein [Bacteroidia bacterium]